MPYRIIPVTPYEQNCSLIWCETTREAAVVDPGGDLDRIEAVLAAEALKLTQIWLTHGHLDHVGGVAELAARHDLPIIGPHIGDKFWIDALPQQAQMMRFKPSQPFTPTHWLEAGDTVRVGEVELQVLFCPGHTPGHIVFFDPQARLAFVGDVLFAGSIGRTDFPGGHHDTLIRSIREQLFPLGDDVAFVPGHGPMSTLGQERVSNPFVADKRFG